MVIPTNQPKLRLRKQAAPVLALLFLAGFLAPNAAALAGSGLPCPPSQPILATAQFQVTVSSPANHDGSCGAQQIAVHDIGTGITVHVEYVRSVLVVAAVGAMEHNCSGTQLAAGIAVLTQDASGGDDVLVFASFHSPLGGIDVVASETSLTDVQCQHPTASGANVSGSGTCVNNVGSVDVGGQSQVYGAPGNYFGGLGPCVLVKPT